MKAFFTRQWEGIVGNLIASLIWLFLGWITLVLYGLLSKKGWDFLGLETTVGVFIAIVCYLLMAIGIGLVLWGIFYVTFIRNKAKTDEWKDMEVKAWNPEVGNFVQGGIEIANNKAQNIKDCYVELIEIYQKDKDKRIVGLYRERNTSLPSQLAWQINNDQLYERIEIEKSKRRQVAIAYSSWFISDVSIPSIKGKNFDHSISEGDSYFLEIEVIGKIHDETLMPKRIFVALSYLSHRFVIEKITNELPIE